MDSLLSFSSLITSISVIDPDYQYHYDPAPSNPLPRIVASSLSSFLPTLIFPFFLILFSFLAVPFFFFLYFLSPSPRAVLSTLLRYSFYGICLLLFLFGTEAFLSLLLGKFGFASAYEVIEWNKDTLRSIFIALTLSVGGFFFLKKVFFPKSVFFFEGKEEKSPMLFASTLMHAVFAKIFLFLLWILAFLTLDYVLSFLLSEGGHKDGLEFFISFISFSLPALVLLLLSFFAFFRRSILLPRQDPEKFEIFYIITLTISGIVLLFTLGLLCQNWLNHLYNASSILGRPLSATALRPIFITFLLSLGIHLFLLFQKFTVISACTVETDAQPSPEKKVE